MNVLIPTWGDLVESFCSIEKNNVHYEPFATRRYNFAASVDNYSCRLIFLKDVTKDKQNKTLRRNGRFIWCRNLRYEGRNGDGFRSISFTIDRGKKRFCVGENNMLCLPSHICVSHNRFFNSKAKTFLPFSTVFSYEKSFNMMVKNGPYSAEKLCRLLRQDNPYVPGTLVTARRGYFQPQIQTDQLNKNIFFNREHPCGIILGPSAPKNSYVSREFYRVRFGNTTYDKVHPVQMEIINEI